MRSTAPRTFLVNGVTPSRSTGGASAGRFPARRSERKPASASMWRAVPSSTLESMNSTRAFTDALFFFPSDGSSSLRMPDGHAQALNSSPPKSSRAVSGSLASFKLFLPCHPCSFVYCLRHLLRHSADLLQVVEGSLRYAPRRTEMLQQGFLPAGADAGDRVEPGARGRPLHQAAVEGDGDPVRFIPDPLNEEQGLGVPRQEHRFLLPRQIDLLEPLGERDGLDAGDAEDFQHVQPGVQLPLASVEDYEVRPLRPYHGRGRDSSSVLQLFLVALEAPVAHLPHHAHVVDAGRVLDCELAVLPSRRVPLLEDHHRADRGGPRESRDIVALDPQREPLQSQRGGELRERGFDAAFVARPRHLRPLQCQPGVGPREPHLVALLAFAGDAYLAPGSPLRRQPLHEPAVVGRHRGDEDKLRDGAGLVIVSLQKLARELLALALLLQVREEDQVPQVEAAPVLRD